MAATPSAAIIIRVQGGKPFYEAKFRHDGRQVKRRIGPAWLERDETRDWRRRRGRVPDGYYHREKPDKNLVDVADDAQDAELVRLAAYAGLRLGELLALRWS